MHVRLYYVTIVLMYEGIRDLAGKAIVKLRKKWLDGLPAPHSGVTASDRL